MITTVAQAADESCSTKIFFANDATSARLPGVTVEDHRFVVSIRINENKEDLRFVLDTGAGRTVLSRAVAQQLGLRASAKGSMGGVGTGRVDVEIVKNATIQLGDVRLEGVDLNLVDDVHGGNTTVGIIGYDLLCGSVVTLDYKQRGVTVTAPSVFHYQGNGEVLPLTFKGRWPYVRGTLKVPGVEAVTDDFLIDTGSEDAVNHPIIRQSNGELRQTQTGAGGFGQSLPGVIGPNEWFRIGHIAIGPTQSVCCAANEDVSRQLGGTVLSHFRIIFNYPSHSVVFEKYSDF